MNCPEVIYRPRPNATPETEISALAACYRFILDCHAKKEGARPGAPDDTKESKHDGAATKNRTR